MKNFKINMSDIGYGADVLGIGLGYVNIKKFKPELAKKINYIPHVPVAEETINAKVKNYNSIYQACLDLYNENLKTVSQGYKYLSLGGDHSLALGSVKASLETYGDDIGLIWIDAHADINRFSETESGNVHGTPVASLTGINEEKYNNLGNSKRISFENIVYVGTRSVDYPEQITIFEKNILELKDALLKSSTFSKEMDKLVKHLKNKVSKVHISLDIDAIDPSILKGVSTPVEGGLSIQEVKQLFETVNSNFEIAAVDIYEFNPQNDIDGKTIDFVEDFVDFLEKL
ncbi:arginase family protein [Mycoplasma sp. P36-A1]|uniref:arginase family protein n=1 Tax=Mycoplasma sp. P36-A1 TaxID=3252900 RepID=UPI003C2FE240